MSAIKLSRRMTTQDASFLYGESKSGPLHFGGLAIFEGSIDLSRLIDHVERRLHMLPRFRQRLVFAPLNLAHPTLEDDPDFKIRNHIFGHELPIGSGEAEVTKAVLRIFEPPLDRGRPLWEMHLFHGLDRERSAVLWKIHHCIVDGVSWVEVLTALMDFTRHAAPAGPQPIWEPKRIPGTAQLLTDAAFDLTQTQLSAARRLLIGLLAAGQRARAASGPTTAMRSPRALRQVVAAPWNRGVVTKARSLAWLRQPLKEVSAIRKAFGGTVNDLVLTALSEGAARYLEHHSSNAAGLPLRIGCPVSVRTQEEMGTLGNRVSMMAPELEGRPLDPVTRLKSVSNETARIKSANDSPALELMMAAADLVPPALMEWVSSFGTGAIDAAARLAERAPRLARLFVPRSPLINFIATNVRGPQLAGYLVGHKMLDYLGLIPLGGNLGYSVVISTYNQNLYLALMAEPNLMPDVELMKSYVGQAFEELKLAARRRIRSTRTWPLQEGPQAAA